VPRERQATVGGPGTTTVIRPQVSGWPLALFPCIDWRPAESPQDRIVSPQRPRPVYDRWRDAQGIHIDDGCRVEQIHVDKQYGALSSRLGKRGVVVGRAGGTSGNRVYVEFDGENKQVSIRPHLVLLLPTETETPLSAAHIVGQLRDLWLPAPAGDDHA
jgi:hypothetical protein